MQFTLPICNQVHAELNIACDVYERTTVSIIYVLVFDSGSVNCEPIVMIRSLRRP